MKDLGLRIRAARKLHKYSLEVLGEISGVSYATIGNAETGRQMPNLLSTFCIAEVLHVSLDWLTGRSPAISDTELKAEELLINGKIKFKTAANVGCRGYIPRTE